MKRREPESQGDLPFSAPVDPALPTTRYQGSKAKLTPWLRSIFGGLTFSSALDLFSGTASVAYLFKSMGKLVHANDVLVANAHVARALVANPGVRLDPARAASLFEKKRGAKASTFIQKTFRGVFFLPEENRWLDVVAENIAAMPEGPERSLAYFALFQACLKKRPFNLFHRKNLGLRLADVERSFGNKRTWDAPFEEHFLEALGEANRAVFDDGRAHRVTSSDALVLEATADLVYLDPPYVNGRGEAIDYVDFYHFLEGLTDLDAWPGRLDATRPHKPIVHERSAFSSAKEIGPALARLFDRHRRSTLVVSYREDGVPSPGELTQMLQSVGKQVTVQHADQQYALSKKRTHELVFVAV
jgi:adenine-specific DNA methylase